MSPGKMYWWRYKGDKEWRFGYSSYVKGSPQLIRMGRWNGDTIGGSVVSQGEIEWKNY